jgi:hypothetical protein
MAKFVDPYYQGHTKVNYKLNEELGEIQVVQVPGWEAEFDSTERAWEEIRSELVQSRKRIREGKASPLEYFMKKRMMTSRLLAAEAGICHLFTLRHLKNPHAWEKLSQNKKEKYAKALSLPVEELAVLPEADNES